MAKRDRSTHTLRPSFEAAITKQECHEGEKKAQAFGLVRREAYAVLTRSAAQLLKGMDGEIAEALVEVAENIDSYLKWREHETELLQAAYARVLAVLLYNYPAETVPNVPSKKNKRSGRTEATHG